MCWVIWFRATRSAVASSIGAAVAAMLNKATTKSEIANCVQRKKLGCVFMVNKIDGNVSFEALGAMRACTICASADGHAGAQQWTSGG
jgi:hypothetical protein